MRWRSQVFFSLMYFFKICLDETYLKTAVFCDGSVNFFQQFDNNKCLKSSEIFVDQQSLCNYSKIL